MSSDSKTVIFSLQVNFTDDFGSDRPFKHSITF